MEVRRDDDNRFAQEQVYMLAAVPDHRQRGAIENQKEAPGIP